MKYLIAILFVFALHITPANAQLDLRDYVALGIGPSMIYGDNTGSLASFNYRFRPSASLMYNYQLRKRWDVRVTSGVQVLDAGGVVDDIDTRVQWGIQDQAYNFTGQAYYADIMPLYQFNPNRGMHDMYNYKVNVYAGLGVGIMHVRRQDNVLLNPIFIEETGEYFIGADEAVSRNTTTPYIPLRIGASSNFRRNWDIGAEITLMTSFTSDIDGNNIRVKEIENDMLFQFQIMVRRYIGRHNPFYWD
ncbi:outer membrane beta-barrel protein [Litoribacter ruber]|uniref:Outer membrane beta-barrel protein n=1 Tax=Litoribacter ruber TaxID=702568 RepID=A0AAP2CMC7_9BACT|nr:MULTISPECIES: outer membrane beta-barrel protein [Litoribacter]MBS9525986.1 outer membrane beta-barrel protein [Litoribacter alkaliphilus]MBT0813098.1 outer membrane beta-barrel protein [Litoribacter ruber]